MQWQTKLWIRISWTYSPTTRTLDHCLNNCTTKTTNQTPRSSPVRPTVHHEHWLPISTTVPNHSGINTTKLESLNTNQNYTPSEIIRMCRAVKPGCKVLISLLPPCNNAARQYHAGSTDVLWNNIRKKNGLNVFPEVLHVIKKSTATISYRQLKYSTQNNVTVCLAFTKQPSNNASLYVATSACTLWLGSLI